MNRPVGKRTALRAAVAALIAAAGAARASGQCEVEKLLASDGSTGDFFGTSVDVDGDAAVVGGFYSNAAYVYRFDGSTWAEEAVLVAADAAPEALFGSDVAIDGDVVIIGASGDDENGGFAAGAAYVFRFRPASGTWVQEAKLLASDGAHHDRFGGSVAISGQVAVIGAEGVDNETSGNGGAAYVYRFDGSRWLEEQKLLITEGAGSDHLGWSVAIDGDVVIVGAFGRDGNATASGAAFVYRFDGGAWVEEAELLDAHGAPFDNFGQSVAISGHAAVVGSPDDDDNGGMSGSAFVFRFDGLNWTREAHLLASDGEAFEHFGCGVALDGNLVVVAALADSNHSGVSAGAAYVFRFDCPTWLEEAKLVASDGASFDNFGGSVAVSGDVVVVGAGGDDDLGDGSGSAYVIAGLRGIDCNDNGVADACDLDAGSSQDADGNQVPDECDCPWDLDGGGVVGVNDFLALLAAWGTNPGHPGDFDHDGSVGFIDFLALLGHWGPCPLFVDCNENGVFDAIDLQEGTSQDCNDNGIPDECDLAGGASPDCNSNGVPDECDFCGGDSPDCNHNAVPDECDVATGASPEVNGNGIPDECDYFADDCADAIAIADGATPFLTIGATIDGPATVCGQPPAVPIVNDIWFAYTASCTGTVTLSLCNAADFDTILAVYFGETCPSPTAINPLACSDDAPGCGQTSEVQFAVAEGFTYLVRVGGAESDGTGILTVSCNTGP